MSQTRQALVEELFLAAADLPPDERARFIARRCGADDGLRREVESLLAHHSDSEQSRGFLDSRIAPGKGMFTGIGATALKGDEPLLPADRRLGQYTVKAMLGQGGMGVVYLAEQDRPKRTVALKVMRRGVGSERHVRRFEFEAEMLGKLHHPGIAQVYEAGTFNDPQTGRPHPYIAMELIRGRPLIQHAQHLALSTRQRLELVALVCDAVEHAHMCGVIHRDLKPANILVTDDGQPKILDFGVARAIDRDIALTTMQTSVGQIIGTLPYMSPEQIAGDQNEVDTRSDVYALGVVLYELLTERLPYQLRGQSIPEAARLVRESPPTRLSTLDRTLRGDVDTIVSKALAKEKHRRYQSAASLAADLRAYLDGRPISARQDSALYVLRKQIQRYKGGVAAAVIFIAGVLAFAVYAAIERSRADRAAIRLRQELTFSNIERGRLLGLSGNLAAAEALLWPEHLRNLDSHQTFYALWELYANARCLATIEAGPVRRARMRLSPDGSRLASAGSDPAIFIIDTRTYERLVEIPSAGAEHIALAFGPGDTLAAGDRAGRITLWNARTGASIVDLRQGGPPAIDLEFDPSGARLLASLDDGSLILFDTRQPEQARPDRVVARRAIAAPPARPVRAPGLAASPTSPQFALGCSDAKIRVVSSIDLSPVIEFPNPDDTNPRLRYSPDGARIAAAGAARLTRVFDARTGEVSAVLNAPNGGLYGVGFSADGTRLLTAGWWYLHVWDLSARSIVQSFSLGEGGSDLAVSPDGTEAWTQVSAGLRAWDLSPEPGRTRISSPPLARALLRFAPGNQLISGEGDGSVHLLDPVRGESIATLAEGTRRVRSVAVSPNSTLAASVGVDGILHLFDTDRRAAMGAWPGFKMITNDGLRFNSDASRLVLAAADDSFKVVSVPSGEVLVTIAKDGYEALAAAFSPNNHIIATTTRRNVLCLYDADTGALIRECEHPSACPWTIVFSRDGSRVYSGNWDRSIGEWDVASGRLLRRLEGHRALVTGLAFRPREANILASCGADGRIMLWDVDLPQFTPVLVLDGLDGWEAWALDFDSTGRRLIATNSLGTAVIWDLRHFNRHMGGNMNAQIKAHRAALGSEFNEAAARQQEALLLSRGKKPTPTAAPDAPPKP